MSKDLGAPASPSGHSAEPEPEVSAVPASVPSAWPLRGYAPGNYWCVCRGCGERFDGDKRASECLNCAVRGAKETAERMYKLEAALLPFARAARITTAWDGENVSAVLHYAADATNTISLSALPDARKLMGFRDRDGAEGRDSLSGSGASAPPSPARRDRPDGIGKQAQRKDG